MLSWVDGSRHAQDLDQIGALNISNQDTSDTDQSPILRGDSSGVARLMLESNLLQSDSLLALLRPRRFKDTSPDFVALSADSDQSRDDVPRSLKPRINPHGWKHAFHRLRPY